MDIIEPYTGALVVILAVVFSEFVLLKGNETKLFSYGVTTIVTGTASLLAYYFFGIAIVGISVASGVSVSKDTPTIGLIALIVGCMLLAIHYLTLDSEHEE